MVVCCTYGVWRVCPGLSDAKVKTGAKLGVAKKETRRLWSKALVSATKMKSSVMSKYSKDGEVCTRVLVVAATFAACVDAQAPSYAPRLVETDSLPFLLLTRNATSSYCATTYVFYSYLRHAHPKRQRCVARAWHAYLAIRTE